MSVREVKRRLEKLEAIKRVEQLGFIVAILDGGTYEVNGEKLTQAEFEKAYADDDNLLIYVFERLEALADHDAAAKSALDFERGLGELRDAQTKMELQSALSGITAPPEASSEDRNLSV